MLYFSTNSRSYENTVRNLNGIYKLHNNNIKHVWQLID